MKKLLTILAFFAAVFAVSASEAALDTAKTATENGAVEAAKTSALPAKIDDLLAQNPNLKRIQDFSEPDDLFDWYQDPANGRVYLVYIWGDAKTMGKLVENAKVSAANLDDDSEKEAVIAKAEATKKLVTEANGKAKVYSCSFAKGDKLYGGREIMIVNPVGRSKGKVKLPAAMKAEALRDGLKAAAVLEAGDVIGEFMPAMLFHDSLLQGSKAENLPTISECFSGLWESTGVYDLIRQNNTDWVLGLRKILMMFVALVPYVSCDSESQFEPLLLLPIGFGALLANIPLAA